MATILIEKLIPPCFSNKSKYDLPFANRDRHFDKTPPHMGELIDIFTSERHMRILRLDDARLISFIFPKAILELTNQEEVEVLSEKIKKAKSKDKIVYRVNADGISDVKVFLPDGKPNFEMSWDMSPIVIGTLSKIQTFTSNDYPSLTEEEMSRLYTR